MACVDLPIPTLPVLGLGLSLEPPSTPPIDFDLNLCCKIASIHIPPIPLPLPPLVVNLSTAALVDAAMAAIEEFLNQIPLPDCPKE